MPFYNIIIFTQIAKSADFEQSMLSIFDGRKAASWWQKQDL